MKNYKTIQNEAIYEETIKKSKFICYIKPVDNKEDAEDFIERIKKRNYDATHNVPVYLIGANYKDQKYSDDGEPSGTAGLPVIEMLKNENITNLVLVITRYFGGTKLGTGGLVRAYTSAAKGALEKAHIIKKEPYKKIKFEIDYNLHGKINNYLQNETAVVIDEINFLEVVEYNVFIKVGFFDKIYNRLVNFTNGKIQIEELGKFYLTI